MLLVEYIGGYKTNHSLWVTSATRLFQNGAEEQLIMGVTGHHSTEGVRTYKRVSSEQREALPDILNTATNGKTSTTSKMPTNDTGVKKCKVESKENNFGTMGRDMLPFRLQISGCQGVTVNYIGMKP